MHQIALITALLATACQPTAARSSPDLAPASGMRAMALGRVPAGPQTLADEAWRWQAVSDREWFDLVAPYAGLPGREAEPRGGADRRMALEGISARLDHWLARLHAVGGPDGAGPHPAPVPSVVVIKDDEANAFVAPVPVCVGVRVELETRGAVDAGGKALEVPLIWLTPEGESRAEADTACVRRELTDGMLLNLTAAMAAQSPGCVIRVANSTDHGRVVRVGGACRLAADLAGVGGARGFIYDATANRIQISTGLIDRLKGSERLFLPTLAHEITHYHEAHPSRARSEGEGWFVVDGRGPRSVAADDPLAAEGARVAQFARLAAVREIPGAKLAPALFGPAVMLVTERCAAGRSCPPRCATLAALTARGDVAPEAFAVEEGEGSEGQDRSYLKYERQLLDCADGLRYMAAGSGDPAAGEGGGQAVSREELRQALITGQLAEVAAAPDTPGSLASALAELSRALTRAAKDAAHVVAAGERAGLARRTFEVAADEGGLKRFMALGFRLGDWIEAEVALESETTHRDPEAATLASLFGAPTRSKAGARAVRGGGGDFDLGAISESIGACRELQAAGWRLPGGGEAVVPPRGNFASLHPSACYRLWHAERLAGQIGPGAAAPAAAPEVLEAGQWRRLIDRYAGAAPPARRRGH